jgi:plastocyanin
MKPGTARFPAQQRMSPHGRGRRSAGLLVAGLALWPLRATAQTVDVLIQDYKYVPAALKVKVGTTVKWINNEKRTTHSILFTGPGGFESERIFPGESWQRKFDAPGSFAYSCGPHPEMKGQIDVAP